MTCVNSPQGYGDCGCGGHGERQAPPAPYNPPGRDALAYRVGTHATFRAALHDRLASAAYPALRGLTVRTPDDPALGLVDAWAVLGDVLTFHGERIADEGYLRTAREDTSLTYLGRLVGHQGRPGLAATTHLAYTVERVSRTDDDQEVLIPRGSRSHSVPTGPRAGGDLGGAPDDGAEAGAVEEAQTFETEVDLVARASWNDLPVRRRRPALLDPETLAERSEILVDGTATGVGVGDQLLFVFGGGTHRLVPVEGVRVDRQEGVTALQLPDAPPSSLAELRTEVARWITEPRDDADDDGETGRARVPEATPENPNPRPVSGVLTDLDRDVLTPLRADLPEITTHEQLVRRLAAPLERISEAEALAAPWPTVAAWCARLGGVLHELVRRAADLGDVAPGAPTTPGADEDGAAAALHALTAALPALRTGPSRPAARAGAASAARGTGLAAHLAAALSASEGAQDPASAREAFTAWRAATTPATASAAPDLLRELLVMRVRAAPFGATAPLQPVVDQRGRTVRQSDWPIGGASLTTVRVVYDTAGGDPVRVECVHAGAGRAEQHRVALPAAEPDEAELGPGTVTVATGDGDFPDTVVRLWPGLPPRTVSVAHPGAGGQVRLTVDGDDVPPLVWHLEPGAEERERHGDVELRVRYPVRDEPTAVEVAIGTAPDPETRHVLPLDAVHDGVTVGSRVVVTRPDKGDSVPGDPALASVTTRVTAVRTATYADYGITGRGTQLTLADPWLDDRDTLLSAIRGTTVHAAGAELPRAGEPLGTDVHGDTVDLDGVYEGLEVGRTLAVTGERADVPGRGGVTGTELAVLAAVDHRMDPRLPGDRVHTRLTLTSALGYRYRRETVRILGNVVPASHGETRDEAIGSGDSGRRHQTFPLWRAPLTWHADDTPAGASPSLDIHVAGLRWHRVDSFAGHGPADRVYVLGTDPAGRTTVTFGDGVRGARLPSGHENVRARYRFGTGAAGNLPAGSVTHAVSRPLGVTGVTNPLPATGGADPDRADLARRGPGLGSDSGLPPGRRRIPLAVSALDRLVSVRDYEDFARSRAGIGRAVAREVHDGGRRLLHLTVAGTDDVPLGQDGEVLRGLRAALAEYGDPRLPVRVEVRELVLLLLAARVRVSADHRWERVAAHLRRALHRDLGFPGRELAQPALLSEVQATAHTVPGVDWIDVDVLTGVPASARPAELLATARDLVVAGEDGSGPRAVVPARPARAVTETHRVTARQEDDAEEPGETLTGIARRYGLGLAELLRLNPDITDTRRLAPGRVVTVRRGVRPAQLALLTPGVPGTLTLTEVQP